MNAAIRDPRIEQTGAPEPRGSTESGDHGGDREVEAAYLASVQYWALAWIGTILGACLYGLPFAIVGALSGFFLAAFWGAIIIGPLALCLRALTGTWRPRLGPPALGGLVGLASYATFPGLARAFTDDAALAFFLGPAMTVTLGEVGAVLLIRIGAPSPNDVAPGPLRFSVKTLLAASTWAVFWLTVVKACGGFEPGGSQVVAGGLAWYAGSLPLWATSDCRRGTTFAHRVTSSVPRETTDPPCPSDVFHVKHPFHEKPPDDAVAANVSRETARRNTAEGASV